LKLLRCDRVCCGAVQGILTIFVHPKEPAL